MPSDLTTALQDMQSQIAALVARVSSQEEQLTKLQDLVLENKQLREEVTSLKARLAAVSKDTSFISSSSNAPHTVSPSSSAISNSVESSTWATVVKKHRPPHPPASERKQAAAARGFQIPSGPQGFGYIFIPRAKRMDRPEIRRRLRKLGLESARILDISIPTRNVIGLLVHAQYEPVVKELLQKVKVTILSDFDPVDPSHLADPQFKDLPDAERAAHALQLNRQRCMNALKFIRPPVAAAVCRNFFQAGWISDEDVQSVLASAYPPRDRDNPAAGFIKTDANEDDDKMLDDYSAASAFSTPQ